MVQPYDQEKKNWLTALLKQWRQIDKKVREFVGSLIVEAKIEKP